MQRDAHGLALSTSSDAAARAFDRLVGGFLGNRADLGQRLDAVLREDPDFALAHVARGYLAMLGFCARNVPLARSAAAEAQRLAASATPREQSHAAALAAWADGFPERATAIWDAILTEHPHDILAFRLAHFLTFWMGFPERMLASVHAVEPAWSSALPGWATVLACRCFALEECGEYAAAEAAGRAAIAHDRTDLWAAHGVAHVMEMQDRRDEGLAWIAALAPGWEGTGNLRHHLFWHAALFELERGNVARVLELYDREFRKLDSPLTEAAPDLYIDVQNAASMLFRLRLKGVDVGDRWEELADKAERRSGDCLSAFTLPHWMMALAATGRFAAATRMLAQMQEFAQGPGETAAAVREGAVPACRAILAHAQGSYDEAVATLRPALGAMHRMGGSHAQQDVLERLFLDAALKGGREAEARLAVARISRRRPALLMDGYGTDPGGITPRALERALRSG